MEQARIELFDRLTWKGRRYYWRAVARNGQIVAIGGEAYNSAAKRDHGRDVAASIFAGWLDGDFDCYKAAK